MIYSIEESKPFHCTEMKCFCFSCDRNDVCLDGCLVCNSNHEPMPSNECVTSDYDSYDEEDDYYEEDSVDW
jgi:hypothetical protein